MFLAFGLVMEFPIVLYGLSRVGDRHVRRLAASRRMRDPGDRDLRRGRHARAATSSARWSLGVTMYILFELTVFVHPAHRPVTSESQPAARAGGPRPSRPRARHVVILSGLSGGGKTAAAKLFEDLGYTVVDNLPGELLPELAELVASDASRFARVAIVLDVRAGDAPIALGSMRGALEGRGIRPQVVLPRGARRGRSSGASPRRAIATRSPTPAASPARSPTERRLPRGDPRRGRRRHRHHRAVAARAPRAAVRPASAT